MTSQLGSGISTIKNNSSPKIRPYIIACIPVYNEESSIAKIVLSVKQYVNEVIVCDDGSIDYTADIASKLGAILIKHEKNQGYGASIISLFNAALKIDADYIITIDGDGQHQSSDIMILLNRIMQGDVDIVVGSRFIKGSKSEAPSWRNAGIKIISCFASHGDEKIKDAQSGFRIYTQGALRKLDLTEDGMGISTEIIMKSIDKQLKIAEVPITVSYGKNTSTSFPISHGLGVLFSTFKYLSMRKPLLFFGLPGLIASCISVVFGVWAVNVYISTKFFETNIALISFGTFMIGLILMTTGIILWVVISVVREKTTN